MILLLRIPEYQGFDMEQQEGDAQSVYILTDGSKCICGHKELYSQYYPKCGEQLIQEAT